MTLFQTALALAAAALHLTAAAQDYPNRPVRIVIPYAAGGGVDGAARIVAQHLQSALGQNFLVDPKPGANTVIGADSVARAAPDGYTLLLTGGSTMSLLPTTQAKLPFDPVADFAPVGMVSRLPFFLVTPTSLPYKSAKELMQAAREAQGAMSYASNGTGATSQLASEMLLQAAGVKMVHVPYNGFTPALSDLVTGRVAMLMADLAPVNSQLQAGKLRALAVASAQRARFMPDVPTLAEAGYPNCEFEVWLGLYAPAKTPREIVDRVSAELSKFLASPAAREAFERIGHEPDARNGDYVRQRNIAEQKTLGDIARSVSQTPAK